MKALTLLLATDGSPSSLHAAEWLNQFVSPEHTQITLATVVTVPTIDHFATTGLYPNSGELYQEALEEAYQDAQKKAQSALTETAAKLTACPPVTTVTLSGNPADAIVDYAQSHHVDVIVMGRRGHSALGNLFGSVSFGVLQRSKIPVTIVEMDH